VPADARERNYHVGNWRATDGRDVCGGRRFLHKLKRFWTFVKFSNERSRRQQQDCSLGLLQRLSARYLRRRGLGLTTTTTTKTTTRTWPDDDDNNNDDEDLAWCRGMLTIQKRNPHYSEAEPWLLSRLSRKSFSIRRWGYITTIHGRNHGHHLDSWENPSVFSKGMLNFAHTTDCNHLPTMLWFRKSRGKPLGPFATRVVYGGGGV